MKRVIRTIVSLAVAAAAGWSVYYFHRYVSEEKTRVRPSPTAAGESVLPVRVARVERGYISSDAVLTGNVSPAARVTVFSRLPGPHRLEKLFADTGDRVKKGSRIAALQSDMLEAQAAQARAGVHAARAALARIEVEIANLRKNRERLRNLYREHSVPKKDLDDIESAYESARLGRDAAQAALEQARAGLRLAELRLGEAVLRAPVDGVVSRRYVDEGDMISPGRPIADIVAIDTVKITAELPERYLAQVTEGKKVTIRPDAYPDRVFSASISRVHPELNPRSRTVTIECTVPNREHLLKPGMFVREIRIPLAEKKDALVLPHEAIVREDGRTFVFRVDDRAVAHKVEVKTGITAAHACEITAGIGEGDRVVVEGTVGLADGTKVIVGD